MVLISQRECQGLRGLRASISFIQHYENDIHQITRENSSKRFPFCRVCLRKVANVEQPTAGRQERAQSRLCFLLPWLEERGWASAGLGKER